MKLAIITPVGPGHEEIYKECLQSIKYAWDKNSGKFTSIEIIALDDLEGKHGRSARRNDGIKEAQVRNCEWLFFLDADDLLSPNAFKEVSTHLEDADAIWGSICEASYGDNQIRLRDNQLLETKDIDDVLNTDPYLTLQMGHFVRTECAAFIRFDESMDTGEDFRYYLSIWEKYHCKKVQKIFFINKRGNHSTGPRSANGQQWRDAVENEIAKTRSLRQNKVTLEQTNLESYSVLEKDLASGKIAVIVAHPDDEILWCGGLLIRNKGFDVICCSIPYRDPERVLGFFKAMKMLGHHPFLLPFSEESANTPLKNLNLISLQDYEIIITHNEQGEYGHLHHQQVNQHITQNFFKKIYSFGFGNGKIVCELSPEEQAKKLTALKCYSHKSSTDSGLLKWDALLRRYNIDLSIETYNLITASILDSACGKFTNDEIRKRSDYQIFSINDGKVCNIGDRLQKKLLALNPVLPAFENLRVLDIGCDFGFWSFTAASAGAQVVGLDRSRAVRNLGHVNIPLLNNQTAIENRLSAQFYDYQAGNQWWDFIKFDLVFCMSLYHHIFNLCHDHLSIWFWLSRITKGVLIWENPVDDSDTVVQMNLASELLPLYNEKSIRQAALNYFDIDFKGPAIHEVTRTVWKLKPKKIEPEIYCGTPRNGAGGATKAFQYSENRRINEIKEILGKEMIPGSLNITLEKNFDWDAHYFRAQLFDLKDRSTGLNGAWYRRWVRFYPVTFYDSRAWIMRFEGEQYPLNFIELISDQLLAPLIHNKKYIQLAVG
jgi:SAM-dependent methyltransferase